MTGSVPERRVNDVGGLPGGIIDRDEHGVTLFEKRVDAMLMLLVGPSVGAFTVDALRRAVENNSPEEYTSLGYYVKWLNAIRDLLAEQGVVDRAELDRRIAALAAAEA
jgi:hypothetical protein